MQNASEAPGSGQKAVVRPLRELNKLRIDEDAPDLPAYIRDRTRLKKGQITTFDLRAEFRKDPALPMLIGDGIFVKAIRQGVEQGDYVYQSGDLLYGKGDPQPQIRIDEQSLVFTVAYANEKGIWPRRPPEPTAVGIPAPGAGNGGVADPDATHGTADAVRPGAPVGQSFPPQPEPELKAEGVLREALTQLWEQARGKRIDALAQLSLRLFEACDGFRLMGAVNAVNGATKVVRLHGGYQTNDRGTLHVEFSGPINDALPIKDFLDPQFRAAKDRDFDLAFDLDFTDGLSLGGDAPEKLTERLARYSSGAAYVTATARTQH